MSLTSGEIASEVNMYVPISIAFQHKLHGVCLVAPNGCAASAMAMGESFKMIRDGY